MLNYKLTSALLKAWPTLTVNLYNAGKTTSPSYWPMKEGHFGDVFVKSEDTVLDDLIAIRGFSIGENNLPQRQIRHFHFKGWPQSGAPESAEEVLSLRDQVIKWHREKPGPILVHCR